MADVTLTIGGEDSSYMAALNNSKEKTRKFGTVIVDDLVPKFGTMAAAGTTAFGVVSAGAAPAAAAVGAIGLAAFNVASDFSNATQEIQNALGLTADEAQIFGEVANEVFKSGVGDSLDEVSAALIATKQNFGEMVSASDIGVVTTQAMDLAEIMGEDVNKTLNASATLAREMGISHNQAMDLIITGSQNGLNASGDLLDTVAEYSNVFADSGLSAEQMFALLESGAAGGVLGVDKIADSVKEMGVKLNEGGEPVEEAFRNMDLAFRPFQEAVASGEKQWGDFLPQIIDGINGIEDPTQQAAAQVAVFGTMFEDLGVGATEGLTTVSDTFTDIDGAMANASENSRTLGDRFSSVWRSALDELRPLGEGIMDIAEASLPVLTEGMDRIKNTITAAGPIISNAMSQISSAFGGSGEAISGMDIAIGILSAGIDVVVSGVQTFTVVMWALGEAINGIASFFEPLDEKLTNFIDKISSFEMPDFSFPGFGGEGEGGSPFDFLPGFADGGFVPGSPGQAVPIMAHGGEFVLSNDMISSLEAQGRQSQSGQMGQGTMMPPSINATTTDVILDGQSIGQFIIEFQGNQAANAGAVGFSNL